MDNRHLRSILINLQYRLSDSDRERLHFYLKNDVPRPVGDDSTLSGTLKLMQSLFDQEKISEKDFTLLIEAFQQIRCFDAVNLLKGSFLFTPHLVQFHSLLEHQRRMLLSGLNQSTQSLASIMPSLIEEFLYDNEDDQDSTDNCEQINDNNNTNNIIDSNNININVDTQRISSSSKHCFCMPSLTKKCFLLPLILFILTLGTLIIVLIEGIDRINSLKNDLRVEQNFIVETQDQNNRTVKQSNSLISNQHQIIEQLNKALIELNTQNNQTVKQLNDFILEKNAAIQQLNKIVIESKNERRTLLIKAGRKFGGNGGGDFDDSLLPMFTSSHYLSGFLFSDVEEFNASQFIYTSSQHNQSRIESSVHGDDGHRIYSTYKYELNDDERIERVQVRSSFTTYPINNKPWLTTKVITGLKFTTTKGRNIPPGIDLKGNDVDSEQFLGYTLGYITGRSGGKIDELQFFWYRTKP